MSGQLYCYSPYHPASIEVVARKTLGGELETQILFLEASRAAIMQDTPDNAKERAWLFDETRLLYKKAVKMYRKQQGIT